MCRRRKISWAWCAIFLIGLWLGPYAAHGQQDQLEELIKQTQIAGVSLTDRLEAIRSLGEFKDQRAVNALRGQLFSREKVVREEAARALGKIGPPAAPAVIFAVRVSANNINRKRVAEALSEIKDPAVGKELQTGLQRKDLPIVAGAYKYYVAQITPKDQEAADTLVQALNKYGDQYMAAAYINSGNPWLQQAGRQWLAQQEKLNSVQEVQGLINISAKARQAGMDLTEEAAKNLVRLGPKALESAAQMLADQGKEALSRQEAGTCLAVALEDYRQIAVSEQVKEELQKAAADDNPYIAGRAKRALGALRMRSSPASTSP